MPIDDSSARRPCADARRDHALDPAPDVEVAHHFHPDGLGRLAEVVEDPVYRALIEDAVVSEAPEIELQALQLDTDVAWDVCDVHRREVWRSTRELPELCRIGLDPAQWTERRELGTLHRDLVRTPRIGIRKRLQQLGSWHAGRSHNCQAALRDSGAPGCVNNMLLACRSPLGRPLPPGERPGGTAPRQVRGALSFYGRSFSPRSRLAMSSSMARSAGVRLSSPSSEILSSTRSSSATPSSRGGTGAASARAIGRGCWAAT